MASFLLAGNVNSRSFTHAERLFDILNQTLPVVHCVKYVCLDATWDAAQVQLCKKFQFDAAAVAKVQCIVWHEDGRYIGDDVAFAEYCRNTYSVTCDLQEKQMTGITQENVAVVNKMFAESGEGTVLLPVEDVNGKVTTQY